MANRPIWTIRQRHEWLTKTDLKRKHLSRRKRARIGLQDALERKGQTGGEQSPQEEARQES